MERGSFGRVVVGGVVRGDRPVRLPAQERRRGPRQRQEAVRREMRARATRWRGPARRGVTGPEPRRGVPPVAQGRHEGLAPSPASSSQQISHPNRNAQVDPATGKTLPLMPAGHRQGRGRPRRRRLRRPGRRRTRATTRAASPPSAPPRPKAPPKDEGGTLDIPVAAAGLAYKFADASRQRRPGHDQVREPAGARSTTSRSRATASTTRARSSPPAASRSSKPTSRPASTRSTARSPGHREGGMEGKLTVK